MFNRILVPLDGSNLAELALPYAEELAGALSSEVDLVEVCEHKDSQHRHMHQLYIEKMAELVRNRIKEVGPIVKVKPVVLDGESAAEIIGYAEKNSIRLIIMATHGRSGIMRWAMGSVANKVLHRISMPMLLIRAKAPILKEGKGEMFSKIVIPLDGSNTSEVVLPYVRELTEKLKSEVILFQAIALGQHVHTIGGLDYVRFTEQQVESMKTEAKRYLEKVSSKLMDTKATIRSEVKVGDAAQEIIKFTDEIHACLVAISTHGRSGIRQWILGSVTNKVLQSGNAHVLLVRVRG